MHASRRLISQWNMIGALVACVGLLWLPQAANAGPIAYTVNQTIGPGSAIGTITTDGTIGTLATANIVGWNLLLDSGVNTTVLLSSTPGNFVIVVGSGLTASPTTLIFNYSAVDSSDVNFYNLPNTGQICYTSYSNCWGPDGVGVYNVGGNNNLAVFIAQTGSLIIASNGTPVPEPATLALFGAGLVGLAAIRRRQSAKA